MPRIPSDLVSDQARQISQRQNVPDDTAPQPPPSNPDCCLLTRYVKCGFDQQLWITGHHNVRIDPAWDGTGERGSDGRRRWQSAWHVLIRTCLELQANPIEYIQRHLQRARIGNAPNPAQICGSSSVEEWRDKHPPDVIRDQLIWDLLKRDKPAFERVMMNPFINWGLLSQDEAYRLAIRNETLAESGGRFSHLFRYCMAVYMQMDDVSAKFHDAALCQYTFQGPAYDYAWGETVLPADLREEGATLRASWLD